MRRRDLAIVTEDAKRRLVIALAKMTTRQGEILLCVRFDDASFEALAARHGLTVKESITDFAHALRMWSRCLHARFPHLLRPWW